MEGWMISLGIALITYVAIIVTNKNKSDSNQRELADLHATAIKIFDRLDKHGDDIVKLNTQSELSMTQKEVDSKYVSKELFRQYEKHIDGRFDRLEEGQGKILSYVEKASEK
jgi:hypothetical protein